MSLARCTIAEGIPVALRHAAIGTCGSPRSVLQKPCERYAMVVASFLLWFRAAPRNLRLSVPVSDPPRHGAASIDQKRGTKIAITLQQWAPARRTP